MWEDVFIMVMQKANEIMRVRRICSHLRWRPVVQEGIEARPHLLRLLLWILCNQQMTVSNISQMALAKLQAFLWGYLESTSIVSLAENCEIWSVVPLALHFLHPSNFIWWQQGEGWCLGFFFLTIMSISTRNGAGFSFRFNKKLPFPYSESVVPDIRSNIYNTFKSVQNELQLQLSWHF